MSEELRDAAREFAHDSIDLIEKIRTSTCFTDNEKREIVGTMRATVNRLQNRFANWAADEIIRKYQRCPMMDMR